MKMVRTSSDDPPPAARTTTVDEQDLPRDEVGLPAREVHHRAGNVSGRPKPHREVLRFEERAPFRVHRSIALLVLHVADSDCVAANPLSPEIRRNGSG